MGTFLTPTVHVYMCISVRDIHIFVYTVSDNCAYSICEAQWTLREVHVQVQCTQIQTCMCVYVTTHML